MGIAVMITLDIVEKKKSKQDGRKEFYSYRV